jgi:hypothetical protein
MGGRTATCAYPWRGGGALFVAGAQGLLSVWEGYAPWPFSRTRKNPARVECRSSTTVRAAASRR